MVGRGWAAPGCPPLAGATREPPCDFFVRTLVPTGLPALERLTAHSPTSWTSTQGAGVPAREGGGHSEASVL